MSEHDHEHGECKKLLSSLGEYIDGTLSGALCEEIERHMQECDRCTVVINTLKKTVELYHQTAADVSVPDDVRKRLYLRLNLEAYRKG